MSHRKLFTSTRGGLFGGVGIVLPTVFCNFIHAHVSETYIGREVATCSIENGGKSLFGLNEF